METKSETSSLVWELENKGSHMAFRFQIYVIAKEITASLKQVSRGRHFFKQERAVVGYGEKRDDELEFRYLVQCAKWKCLESI